MEIHCSNYFRIILKNSFTALISGHTNLVVYFFLIKHNWENVSENIEFIENKLVIYSFKDLIATVSSPVSSLIFYQYLSPHNIFISLLLQFYLLILCSSFWFMEPGSIRDLLIKITAGFWKCLQWDD